MRQPRKDVNAFTRDGSGQAPGQELPRTPAEAMRRTTRIGLAVPRGWTRGPPLTGGATEHAHRRSSVLRSSHVCPPGCSRYPLHPSPLLLAGQKGSTTACAGTSHSRQATHTAKPYDTSMTHPTCAVSDPCRSSTHQISQADPSLFRARTAAMAIVGPGSLVSARHTRFTSRVHGRTE
jgi:hypothetical protein